MSTTLAARTGPGRVFYYGHSFLTSITPTSTAGLIVAGRNIPIQTGAVAGLTCAQLITRQARRCSPYGPLATNSGLIIIAGVNDYADTNNRTGAAVVADHQTIATAALAAGFDWVLASTCPASTIIVTNEAQRLAGNASLLALSGGPLFAGIVDLAASAILAANIAAGDGTHPSSIVGRQEIADLHDPFLDTLIPTAA